MRTLLFFSAFVLFGCSGGTQQSKAGGTAEPANQTSAPPEESGALPDLSDYRCAFSWQQSVSARFGPLESSFEAVVECDGGELKMVGLTPFRTRAFLLSQRGSTFHFEKFVDRELPFSPKQILVDLHRTFFLGFEVDPSARTNRYFGEERRDEMRNEKLVRRTLTRPENPGKSVVITYEGGYDGRTPPSKIRLENGYYGYTLEVVSEGSQDL